MIEPCLPTEPVYSLVQCDGCGTVYAVRPMMGGLCWIVQEAHNSDGTPFVEASEEVFCPLCGGGFRVIADLAVVTENGHWLNISLGDPVFEDVVRNN